MKDFYLRLSRRALSPGGIRVLALMFFVICLSGRANADETTPDTAYYDWDDISLYNLYSTSQSSSVTFDNGSTVWSEDGGNTHWKIVEKTLGNYTYALQLIEGSGTKIGSLSFPVVATCDSCVVTFQMAAVNYDEGFCGLYVKDKSGGYVTKDFAFEYNEDSEDFGGEISSSELKSYTFTYVPDGNDSLYLVNAELDVLLYSVTVITYGSEADEDSEPTVAITVDATNPENEDTVETLSEMEFSLSEEAVVVDTLIDDIMIYSAATRAVWYVDTIYINEEKLYITLTDTIDDNVNIRTVLPKGLLYNETNNTINGDTVFYYTVGTYATGITFTVDPEAGKVDSLTSFTISWGDDVTSVGVNYSDGTYPYIKDDSGNKIQTWEFENSYEDGTTDGYIGFDWINWVFDGYVLLTLEEAITEAGTYTLVFPEGTFLYNDEDGNESAAASYEYVIELASADTTLTLASLETEDGDTVEYIYELQYSAGDTIYLNDSLVGSITVSNGTDTYTVDTAYISNDTVLYIVLSDTITDEGTVTVTLPAALVGDETAYSYDFVSGNVSAEATFSYIVEAPDEGEIWSLSGDINSWSDASGNGYEFTYEGDGVYTLSLETLSGSFKLRKDYAWDDQYGTNGSTINVGETYTLSAGGDNISITDSPELLGVTLTFTIGDSEATLLIEADSVAAVDYSQYSWSLCGEINSWSESDTTYDFTNNGDSTFTLTLDSIDTSAFKLVADHSWDVNFGGDGTAVTIDTAYELVLGSSNNLWMDSTYTNVTMTLDCSVESPTLTVTVEEEATDSTETEEEETEEEESEDTDEESEDTDDESDDSDSDDTESGTGSGDGSDSESEDEEDDSEATTTTVSDSLLIDSVAEYTANQVLTGTNCSVTLGNDTWTNKGANSDAGEPFYAYINGGNNPVDDNSSKYTTDGANVPTSGAYVIVTTDTVGTVCAGLVVNSGKPFYVVKSDGTMVDPSELTIVDGDGNTQTLDDSYQFSSKFYGSVTFTSETGESYYIFCTGSKIGFYGVVFSYEEESTDEEDTDEETDGISNVNIENSGTYDVYTISGMHVMNTADKSDLNSLPMGIYIVNGKKIAIK